MDGRRGSIPSRDSNGMLEEVRMTQPADLGRRGCGRRARLVWPGDQQAQRLTSPFVVVYLANHRAGQQALANSDPSVSMSWYHPW